MTSIAIVTRINKIELPYIGSFISHYNSIGVTRFYFVNQYQEQYDTIHEYISKITSNFKLIQAETEEVNQMQHAAFDCISEEFILHVDADEYLELRCGNSISDLIKKYDADLYLIKWVIVPNDRFENFPRIRGSLAAHTKVLIRKSIILDSKIRIHGYEKAKIKEGIKKVNVDRKHANLIHYWSRTFNDIILKSSVQVGLMSWKNTDEKNIIYPRLKILARLSKMNRSFKLKGFYLNVDTEKESELINSISIEDIVKQQRDFYVEFKRNVNKNNLPKRINWSTLYKLSL